MALRSQWNWRAGGRRADDDPRRQAARRQVVAEGLERARTIVRQHIDMLRRLAQAAQADRYLDGEEIAKIVGFRGATREVEERRLPRIVGRKWRAAKLVFNRGAAPAEA